MAHNATEVLIEWEGKVVPRHFIAGFVVLSYIVSYVGAWTTLEVINRKTGARGLYNWYLLFSSAVTMGGVAIWCMHYIGNRAITIGNGESVLQIQYNSGFTALSFFVPIIVLLAAFSVVGSDEAPKIYRVVLGGTLAGLAICGMHYLGQAGISNYTCIYTTANVIGAAIIAVVASTTALAVFFVLRASWTNTWWKKALTAIILAGAVSGMHWLASVGTQYRLRSDSINQSSGISRNGIVIVVIVLSICTCFTLLGFTLITQHRRARSADRAQQVILASVIFDQDGRLMVTPEGILPSQKITKSFLERSFDDIFGISHPVFLWIFCASRNWRSITSFVPLMRGHLSTMFNKTSRPGSNKDEVNGVDETGEQLEDYSVIFRELFCLAAADLAAQLGFELETLGVLYGDIVQTGQTEQKAKTSRSKTSSPSSSIDLERNTMMVPKLGRGQLLFLVKRASRRESDQLLATGYRFANPTHVVNILAHSMQVNRQELSRHLTDMKEYISEEKILSPGVHLCLFAIRARVGSLGTSGRIGGFDILVKRGARSLLPSMQLPIPTLEGWQLEFLKTMDGYPLTVVQKTLRNKIDHPATFAKREILFANQLIDTLDALGREVNDALFSDSILVARPVSAPCRGIGDPESAVPGTATLISVRHMASIHSRAPTSGAFEFVPLNYFRTQQMVYQNSMEHSAFARRTHREFGPILHKERLSAEKVSTAISSRRPSGYGDEAELMHSERHFIGSRRSRLRHWRKRLRCYTPSKFNCDSSSDKGLVDGSANSQGQTFGGILVSQDIRVDVRDVADAIDLEPVITNRTHDGTSDDSDIELDDRKNQGIHDGTGRNKDSAGVRMGASTFAAAESEDTETFVDKLFSICVEAR